MIGRPRNVGSSGRPLKTELHHWWPRGLSKLWADTDGKVVRQSWNGETRRIPPAQVGAITNAHLMKIGGPWTTTVEPLFSDADSNLPRIVKYLEGLQFAPPTRGTSFECRSMPHNLDSNENRLLGEGLASLLIRCPAHRNLIHQTIERIRGRFGDQRQTKHDDSLIAANIHQHFAQMVQSLSGRGKLILLRSFDSEFVMGEGYLSTLAGYTVQLQYHCMLPLTPSLAVIAFAASRSTSEPAVSSLTLVPEEVDMVNEVTQIYSRDYIFYRRKPPRISRHFQEREFRELTHHTFDWLEALIRFAAWYRPTSLQS